MSVANYRMTEDADPCAIYHDVLVALDASRGINNGQPRLWAYPSRYSAAVIHLNRPG